MPAFTLTLRKELLSRRLALGTLLIACLYLSLSVLLLNWALFASLIQQGESILRLFSLFFTLFGGLWTSLSAIDFSLTILSSLLVGVNFMLLIRTVYLLEHKGKLRFSIGGATLFSIIATGCTSCGLSFLSILGLSASLSFLPFHGLELHISAVFLLGLSIVYMLRQLHNGLYCKIPEKK